MILIIDDDEAIRLSLGFLLKKAGYECDMASNPDEALQKVRQREYELILMDMNFSRDTSGREGLELLMKTKIFRPESPVILITAWGSIDLAVEGMRAGAYDFITKPWHNLMLLQRIETAIKLNATRQEEPTAAGFDRSGIIGNNQALIELLSTVEKISPTDAPVLILGENGTGKELIANAIHKNSKRKENPFVMVNLGGISRSLFESEMFGHVKGAFTGATTSRKGRFEVADKGTIFLDEIGDLDLGSQVKLLRVLQEHKFEPLGQSVTKKVDIRVISATNADIPQMVTDKSFREDLFYRINLITLRIPPLRDRRDDIPLLVRHFIRQAAHANGLEVPEIKSEAIEFLCRLPYPGNIRELKNIIERAVITGGTQLDKSDFSNFILNTDTPPLASTPTNLEEIEKKALQEAMEKSNGNYTQAARILGVTRQSLYRKLEKHGLK
ncbi:MAG: sigma-54-dependent Fis family transcriptional regulator [Muribaculaceae bacterium]|nr:sigma-54-dependent Fis family transcriptional regulator [Muribaculaceae bacterium]